ncbi:DUF4097 domain-containing protein [Rhodocytophaga rosea]|uniref:DUF4097 domain-containing protein n=1 Tax=Rhodocytophaga rosea TaxID=2704465 RepID=A0A6C0GKI8_9BACT|nr:DUF4097 domain-containing protein [Rhodocytophaga rosea]QHT68591.1 DUF4097 domain-containing protein [Rhodocytophaga rosea]
MQKLILFILAGLLYFPAIAQRKFEKTYPLPASRKVNLNFQESSLVKVKAWDKNEVSVQVSVSINNGENDDAFDLKADADNNSLTLETLLMDQENIPRKSFITTRDGARYFVKSPDWNSKEVQELIAIHGEEGISFVGSSIVRDIFIEVSVPRNTDLSVFSKNGDIEIGAIQGPLLANTKNGAVDLSLSGNQKATLELRTRHGEIYTNVAFQQDKASGVENERNDKWNVVSGTLNGGGTLISLESKNGSIYLRKASQ